MTEKRYKKWTWKKAVFGGMCCVSKLVGMFLNVSGGEKKTKVYFGRFMKKPNGKGLDVE